MSRAREIINRFGERYKMVAGDKVIALKTFDTVGAKNKRDFDKTSFDDLKDMRIKQETQGKVIANLGGEIQILWNDGSVTTDEVNNEFFKKVVPDDFDK